MPQATRISPELLKWYDRHRRVLPWRALPGQKPNPYAVWLSEVMLQQTTVATVGPYYHKFLKLWPNVRALAAADRDEVLAAWAGLGYYSRARNLHKCAQVIAREHGGKFPDTEAGLLNLPGIGPYTAAAIAAIAFDTPANVVDGNVERIISRLYALHQPLPGAKPVIKQHAARLVPARRAGDYAQALMDLGATICTPRSPDCPACPLQKSCMAHTEGKPERYPRREAKKAKPIRQGIIFGLHDGNGRLWLRQRPETGLLAAMLELPSSNWQEQPVTLDGALASLGEKLPSASNWKVQVQPVRHIFTHFELRLTVATAKARNKPKGLWLTPQEAQQRALPSIMNKVLKAVLRDI